MRAWTVSSSLLVLLACSAEGGDPSTLDSGEGESTAADASEAESGEESSGETDTGEGETDTGEGETGEPEIEPLCDGSGLAPGDHLIELVHQGTPRYAHVHVPPDYSGTELTPLVLNFHGLGSNATQQAFFSDMNPSADAEGFIVAYPEGLLNRDDKRSWNAGPLCCSDDPTRDDVGFVRALLDELASLACIDPERRYATGMSNGAFMSYRLGCEASDLFAAIAPVAGALGLDTGDCAPERPLPMWAIHGTIDEKVPYDAALASAELWAEQNGCSGEASESFQNGVVSCLSWDCPSDAPVVFCTAEGVNHCWPGQLFCVDPPSTEDIDSTAQMWSFFSAGF